MSEFQIFCLSQTRACPLAYHSQPGSDSSHKPTVSDRSPQRGSAIEIARRRRKRRRCRRRERGEGGRRKRRRNHYLPRIAFFFSFLIFTRACACGACAPLVPSIRTRSWMFNKEIKCLNSHKKKPKNQKKIYPKKQKQKEREREEKKFKTNKQTRHSQPLLQTSRHKPPVSATQEGGRWPAVEELQGGSSGGQRPRRPRSHRAGGGGDPAGERDRGPRARPGLGRQKWDWSEVERCQGGNSRHPSGRQVREGSDPGLPLRRSVRRAPRRSPGPGAQDASPPVSWGVAPRYPSLPRV